MEQNVSKCYAMKADVKLNNCKLWYLPHLGVKHPSKLERLELFSTAVSSMEELH